MNKAITDGVVFMPPAFSVGLDQWSSEDGTPGSATYDGAVNAAFVPADQDFGGCLELVKTASTQKLRYMGQTPMIPGCYLRITARVKAISGNLPSVRIAGWAGDASENHVTGLTETGPSVTLTQYGEIVEVSAIVGSGTRGGVDMPWGVTPIYGHFGLDLTGLTGGVVRIDDIVIEDVTNFFLLDMLGRVDVRDYGAKGDGVTNDSAAFAAADQAAGGRTVYVSAGVYHLADSVTFSSEVEFEGTLVMPDTAVLSLTKNFDLPVYIDAFGDEEQGFRKAFQSLLNDSDHATLDLGGRRITINGPIDMQQAVNNRTYFAQRRVIQNGQLYASGTTVWDTDEYTSQATYSTGNALELTNVTNVANIPVGSLVEGNGVGREVYVRAKNVGAQTLTLSAALYDAAGTQNFTFKRFKYMIDLSGFSQLSKVQFKNVEFQCNNLASGIMLAITGSLFHVKDCWFTRPRMRGITSIGNGCQGMLIDRCKFESGENNEITQDRVAVAINTNGNDVKLRDNWASQFRHWAVIGGGSNVISNNHFFQGDSVSGGIRTAGIVLTQNDNASTIIGNYIDNCFVEWTNEHDASPDFSSGFGFSGLTIQNNVFLCGNVAPWFSFVVVKPYGSGWPIKGLNVSGNMFRVVGTVIDRVERVDTSFANVDSYGFRDIVFTANAFLNVDVQTHNPLTKVFDQNTEATTWVVPMAPELPFGGRVRQVLSAQLTDDLRNSANVKQYLACYAHPYSGGSENQVHVEWPQAVRGQVTVTARCDVGP
ncbi:glycoside hydrolase family 55 protein [Mesobacterium pallidum]|uniref:glycoside hydrolase family 55 protein n=1 Tax=Mesobacterium pallidum TaxID=2872037 RepID=UPI001EE39A48|nr:glycoside hydrolase family 55 protein [Mesobacterium pallidum]